MDFFSPQSLSKLLQCSLANVNWGILQVPPRSTYGACFEEDFQKPTLGPRNTKANELLQSAGPSVLKKAAEAAPATYHQLIYAAIERGDFLQGLQMGM